MAIYRAQVIVQPTSLLIEDASTNTWHFDADSLGDLATISTALIAFYQALRPRYSNLVTQNNHQIKWYRLADPEPRAPVRLDSFNFTVAPSGAALPTEVAIVMSFQGVLASGQPQSRRRGRVYIGPLNTVTMNSSGLVDAGTVGTIVAAASTFLDLSQAATQWKWIIFSTVNGSGVVVDNGWVENAPDTQRRRGRKATIRTAFV